MGYGHPFLQPTVSCVLIPDQDNLASAQILKTPVRTRQSPQPNASDDLAMNPDVFVEAIQGTHAVVAIGNDDLTTCFIPNQQQRR